MMTNRNIVWIMFSAILLVAVGIIFFSSSGTDDSYITYYAADALYEHGKLLNINDEKLLQATSTIFVLVLAAAKVIFSRFSIPSIAPVLSIYFGCCVLYVAANLGPRNSSLTIFSTILLSVNVYFVYWAFSGMETTLVALLVCFFFWALTHYSGPYQQNKFILPISVILLASIRPENFFVLCVFMVLYATLIFRFRAKQEIDFIKHREALYIIGISSFVTFAIVLIFDYAYSGYIFPLPVHAKSSGIDITKLNWGIIYLIKNLAGNIPLLILLVGVYANATVMLRSNNKYTNSEINHLLVASFISAYLLFVVFSGGDWMAGGRFLVPIIPLVYIYGMIE